MTETTTKEEIKMLTDKQKETIVDKFDKSNTTFEIKFLIDELGKDGYEKPNRVIRDALLEGLLYVDTIDDEFDIWLALTDWGRDIWNDIKSDSDE
ncbi:MAG: hypothetical protein WC556_14340 [Candidatus Methanoperedens sp.]